MHILFTLGKAVHAEIELSLSSLFIKVGALEVFVELRPLTQPRMSFDKSEHSVVVNAGWVELTCGH